MIQTQQADIEQLQAKLTNVKKDRQEEVRLPQLGERPILKLAPQRESLNAQITSLSERLSELSSEVEAEKERKKEVEKEQEDLLVLLEEINTKRRRDKELMKGKGIEVSEDEADDEDEEDESEEEDEDEEEEE